MFGFQSSTGDGRVSVRVAASLPAERAQTQGVVPNVGLEDTSPSGLTAAGLFCAHLYSEFAREEVILEL